jgi:hypothetical protein
MACKDKGDLDEPDEIAAGAQHGDHWLSLRSAPAGQRRQAE